MVCNLYKMCKKCKQDKVLTEFFHDKNLYDGLRNTCKDCERIYRKNYLSTEFAKDKQKKSIEKYQNSYRGQYMILKNGANYRNIPFTLSFERFLQIKTNCNNCYYCGKSITDILEFCKNIREYKGINTDILKIKQCMSGSAHKGKGLSIDRKNSFESYNDDNCVLCCSLCNQIKGWAIESNEWNLISKNVIDNIYQKVKENVNVL